MDAQGCFSEELQQILDSSDGQGVTVGDVLDRVSDRGFGLILALLSLPTLIPVLPPGASAVVGALYSILGLQLVLGVPKPWLPNWARKHRLSEKTLSLLHAKGVPLARKIERFSRQRLEALHSRLSLALLGVVIVCIGVLLFLPLPFMNTLPAMAMLLVGLGLINRDGLFALIGALLSLALLFIAIRFSHLLFDGVDWLRSKL